MRGDRQFLIGYVDEFGQHKSYVAIAPSEMEAMGVFAELGKKHLSVTGVKEMDGGMGVDGAWNQQYYAPEWMTATFPQTVDPVQADFQRMMREQGEIRDAERRALLRLRAEAESQDQRARQNMAVDRGDAFTTFEQFANYITSQFR